MFFYISSDLKDNLFAGIIANEMGVNLKVTA